MKKKISAALLSLMIATCLLTGCSSQWSDQVDINVEVKKNAETFNFNVTAVGKTDTVLKEVYVLIEIKGVQNGKDVVLTREKTFADVQKGVENKALSTYLGEYKSHEIKEVTIKQ